MTGTPQQSSIEERPHIEPPWLFQGLDMLLIFLAFILAYVLRYDLQLIRPVLDPSRSELGPYIPYIIVYGGLLYLFFQGNGLYRSVRGRPLMQEVYIILSGVANGTLILLALFFLFQPLVTSRLMLIYLAALSVLLLSTTRVIQRFTLARLRARGIGVQRVLIIGMGEVGQAVLGTMIARSELGYQVVGFLDDEPSRGDAALGRVPGLGRIDRLTEAITEERIDLVVLTLRWQHYGRIMDLIDICRKVGAEVRVVPDIFQLNLRQLQVENLAGIPLLGVEHKPSFRMTDRLLKRIMDVGFTVVTSPLWMLIFGVVVLLMKLQDSGPIFYRQERVGENGRRFQLIKFRTMIPDADKMRAALVRESGQDPRRPKLENDPRITPLGRWLRRTSLDELPNLVNVLTGHMSIVGPRPPTPDEVALYEPWHMRRLNIIPGITGLWQISGRSNVPFEEMCLLDIYYIENWSLGMDLQIIMMTIPRVLMRIGAY